uniref:Exostosin GT47 domain-containing protein n=1 Tax=Aegilops tauschii subsp. strangulata TaxID=200361 RepID=A0A453NP46_AEGTS
GLPLARGVRGGVRGDGAELQGLHLPGRRPQDLLPDAPEAHGQVRQRGILLPEHSGEPLSHRRPRQGRPLLRPHLAPQDARQVLQGTSYENMTMIVKDYVEGLISKYPYWNRTLGADHFFVACHDVGVRAFEGLPFMVKNSIRAVCSPSYNVDFIPHKDVALPQVLQPFALPEGGNDIENR